MELISFYFLFLTGVTLAIYYLLPFRFQNAWLLMVSLVFYLSWGVEFTLLLIGVSLVNFYIALGMAAHPGQKKAFLSLGLVLNSAMLFFFRLTASGYIIRAIEYFTGQPAAGSLSVLNALLPIGFSFYILQAISYLVDVYHKQIKPSDNLIDFTLYMAYFPRLLAGPIERARAFLPRLAAPRRVDTTVLSRAFTLLMIGLLRKMVIAEVLKAAIPEYMFTRPMEYAVYDLVFGIAIYGFWLYNDFAGYTGIVRGVSGFFGIELSPNFQQPFFARSFVEFWNRWHMSLSFWLRDYIYFPVSRAIFRRISDKYLVLKVFLPSIITMLVSGFWHNVGAYMLAWGGLHGIYQSVERMISFKSHGISIIKHSGFVHFLNAVTINILLIPTWILFASGSLQRAFRFVFVLFNTDIPFTVPTIQIIVPVVWLITSLLIDWFQYHYKDEYVFLRWGNFAQSTALAALALVLFLQHLWSEIPVASFVYQGF
jgi:D-alanyl-lipoteichoic acid acyltransferase DltB (MBOAT superfamily)